jgi:hypothetical protein
LAPPSANLRVKPCLLDKLQQALLLQYLAQKRNVPISFAASFKIETAAKEARSYASGLNI